MQGGPTDSDKTADMGHLTPLSELVLGTFDALRYTPVRQNGPKPQYALSRFECETLGPIQAIMGVHHLLGFWESLRLNDLSGKTIYAGNLGRCMGAQFSGLGGFGAYGMVRRDSLRQPSVEAFSFQRARACANS